MSENRKQILEMLAEGRINAGEAERLLAALEGSPALSAKAMAAAAPKYLRVVIEADDKHGGEVRSKVNIRVPLQLLRAGVKLASLLPPEAREQMNTALHEKGLGLDVSQIKPENLDELIANLKDVSIDITGKKNRHATMRVFCE
ncbi:MAG TPA: hypothetical protein VHZ29_07485 [Rhizomicrobium sp.]|jgi:uncharacterized protein YbaP (TraB family)|nr:hypothetical protein [Rhizomicrobium sp.]